MTAAVDILINTPQSQDIYIDTEGNVGFIALYDFTVEPLDI